MTSSCILGFLATRPVTRAHRLANRKVFVRQVTAGCKHNSVRSDKWLEILAVQKDLTLKDRRPELQREERRRQVRSSSGLYKAQE